MAMKECEKEVPSAEVLRAEIEEHVAALDCEGFIAPQTVTDYVLNQQGFLACEAMNRKIGRMTKDLKLSPYITAGQGYYKATSISRIRSSGDWVCGFIDLRPLRLVGISP